MGNVDSVYSPELEMNSRPLSLSSERESLEKKKGRKQVPTPSGILQISKLGCGTFIILKYSKFAQVYFFFFFQFVLPDDSLPSSYLEPAQHARCLTVTVAALAFQMTLRFEMVVVLPTYLLVKAKEGHP